MVKLKRLKAGEYTFKNYLIFKFQNEWVISLGTEDVATVDTLKNVRRWLELNDNPLPDNVFPFVHKPSTKSFVERFVTVAENDARIRSERKMSNLRVLRKYRLKYD